VGPAWLTDSRPGTSSADFHRPSRTFDTSIGIFDGQSDIGGALEPGSATYDAATASTPSTPRAITSGTTATSSAISGKECPAIFHSRPTSHFPNANGFGDRKVVLVIRQNLDDDSKRSNGRRARRGLDPSGLPQRQKRLMKDLEYRFAGLLNGVHAKRVGIEKHGDSFAIFVSLARRADASVWPSNDAALRRAVLCGHRLLFPSARHLRYGSRLERFFSRMPQQGAIVNLRPYTTTTAVSTGKRQCARNSTTPLSPSCYSFLEWAGNSRP